MNEEVKRLIEAIKADDEQGGLAAAAAIASAFLSDVRRIADALEEISRKG